MPGRTRKAAVGAAEFKARCLELVDRVKETRSEYVITRHGRPVARLVPAETAVVATPLGVLRGTVVAYKQPFEPIPGSWQLNGDGDQ
jgi:prevent-host-death family protein